MDLIEENIGFIGFGHMAQVLCRSWIQSKLVSASRIYFVQKSPEKQAQNAKEWGIQGVSLPVLVRTCDLLFLCVRPSQAPEVVPQLGKELLIHSLHSKKIISVLAGVPLSFYQKHLGQKAQLLRVMPNIASAVYQGMSVLSCGQYTDDSFRQLALRFFSCLGQVVEVPESFMDAACAMAGSGPGFVFALIEAMAHFGEKQGLSYADALKVAAQVFLGAARLIQEGQQPKDLIQQIATPGGTTEAGFLEMQRTQMQAHLQQVLTAAMIRSRQLKI